MLGLRCRDIGNLLSLVGTARSVVQCCLWDMPVSGWSTSTALPDVVWVDEALPRRRGYPAGLGRRQGGGPRRFVGRPPSRARRPAAAWVRAAGTPAVPLTTARSQPCEPPRFRAQQGLALPASGTGLVDPPLPNDFRKSRSTNARPEDQTPHRHKCTSLLGHAGTSP